MTDLTEPNEDSQYSEEQYRVLVENSPLGIAVHRADKLVFANKSALAIFGMDSAEDYLGRSVIDFVHPDFREIVADRIMAMHEDKGSVKAVEEKWVRPDGKVIDVEVTGSLISYQGEPAIQVVFFDITERNKAKEALRVSEEKYRLLAENIKDIIWKVDLDMNFAYVSASVEKVLGYKPEEIVSKHISQIMPPESIEAIMAALRDSIRLEESVGKDGYEAPPIEIGIFQKNGTLRTFEISRSFLRDEEDTPIGVLGMARDITDRKEAEEALERAVARAEFYIDIMAHDLANMQQGITASLELLLAENTLTDSIGALAQTALTQTRRATALIGNVKKLATTSKQEIALFETDPYEVLTKAIEMTRDSFPEKELIVTTDMGSGKYEVLADEFLLDVFFNILHNSVKADANAQIEIDVQAKLIDDSSLLELRFEDRGPGISDLLKSSVFSRIEDRERRGSGLGLTLVGQIIDRYGGKVWIEDRVEGNQSHGTCVVLQLPKS